MSKKFSATIFLLITFLFLTGNTYGQQLCKPSDYNGTPTEFYNSFCTTWSYLGPCTGTYNCLAYSIGITNQWVWPWGSSNPTSNQVNTYMSSKGYRTYGHYAKIISYGTTNSIGHFSKVISSSACQAKCGGLNLLQHNSWDPYNTYYTHKLYNYPYTQQRAGYGAKVKVYYKSMTAEIRGPNRAAPNTTQIWSVRVKNGVPPYTYSWMISNRYEDTIDGGTESSTSAQMPSNSGLELEVSVTDSNGKYASDFLSVESGDPELRKAYTETDRDLMNHVAELEFNINRYVNSSNPYDYINNDGFRKIVAMGPKALETIKNRIKSTKENGLIDYILAIAAEKIAAVDLKAVSGKWETGSGWVFSWDRFLTRLPEKVDAILYSSESPDEKSRQIEALGFAALPILEDRIKTGAAELNLPMQNLISKYENISVDSKKRKAATSTAEMIETYRNLLNQAK